jgi:hypothetical protein
LRGRKAALPTACESLRSRPCHFALNQQRVRATGCARNTDPRRPGRR